MSIDYKEKYLKYKGKYLNMKNKIEQFGSASVVFNNDTLKKDPRGCFDFMLYMCIVLFLS